MTETIHRRRVRSYVRREGRMTRAQERALARLWPQYGIEFGRTPLDPDKVFGRRGAPLVVDVGPGMGAAAAALAAARPEYNYLAVEVHRPGIGSLLRLAAERKLDNIRIISHDAVDVIRYMLPDNAITRVLVFFPDPWPKKRHHKRRLLNPGFAAMLRPKLKEHGRVHVSTDWAEYAEAIPAAFERNGYVNLAGAGRRSPRPRWRPATRFELRGSRLGHAVYDFTFARSNAVH